jgi:hypothetical protein
MLMIAHDKEMFAVALDDKSVTEGLATPSKTPPRDVGTSPERSRPAAEPETRTVRRGKPERVVEPRREVRHEPRHERHVERHVVSRPHGLRINVPAIAFRILRHFF